MASLSHKNVIADLPNEVWVKVRFGRVVRDVVVTAIHNEDRGKQRYIYFDGIYKENGTQQVVKHIAVPDTLAKYHNKLIALSFLQEEAELREQELLAEKHGAVAVLRINTTTGVSDVQVKMMPTEGRVVVSLDDAPPVEIPSAAHTMNIALRKGTHVHIAVVDADETEHGIADVVVSHLEQPPLLGVSAREPLTFYVFINGELYEKRARKFIR